MTSITRLLENALYVADLDRSCDFYESVLGLGSDVGTG
jgi:catechol 2,3-dioxygenase-like lactoylglutathione lyase family enzyme